ncbi:MAG: phosphotransferase family protein, partial [Myxococcota bacterium]|nr:phosphotransferase family protein [Myxococcota bacterium]
TNAPAGIKLEAVTAWLQERVHIEPPITVALIMGGHSNLTFRVSDSASRQFVLRRPPLHSVLTTAHDMAREFRIVRALADSSVPVPRLVGMCDDLSVTGAPFYVMHFVQGIVARDSMLAATVAEQYRPVACKNLMTTLSALHQIVPQDIGLDDLARSDAYVSRQLRRWMRQVSASNTRDFPLLHEVHRALVERTPKQDATGIVHGDFRLDNCIITRSGDIAAVLDWELCTLGDTRADLGIILAYWVESEDTLHPLTEPPTVVRGYANRRQLVHWYCKASGCARESLCIDFFYAFANWRLACILEGVYARYKTAAMGMVPADVERFPRTAEALVGRAAATLGGASPI